MVGARRTAEELGRAFPAVPVRTSGRDHVLDEVPDRPALVVCTPGAEPVAAGAGYAAALLLDGWAMLTRPDLRAGEDALRRWIAAASLVRGDGQVVVVAEPDAEVLGPVPLPGRRGEPSPGERALVRVPPGSGAALAAALKSAQASRLARGVPASDAIRIRIDPPDIG